MIIMTTVMFNTWNDISVPRNDSVYKSSTTTYVFTSTFKGNVK